MIDTAWPASPAQTSYVTDMAGRCDWSTSLDGPTYETVEMILGNVGNPDPKFVASHEASAAIRALMPLQSPRYAKSPRQPAAEFVALQEQLRKLNVGRYALPRRSTGEWDFFEVVEKASGARYLNRLLGSPGDYNREHLSVELQAAAARAISGDWVAAAHAFAERTRHCAKCGTALTHARSLAAKIGPKCAKEWGWTW